MAGEGNDIAAKTKAQVNGQVTDHATVARIGRTGAAGILIANLLESPKRQHRGHRQAPQRRPYAPPLASGPAIGEDKEDKNGIFMGVRIL